MLEKNNDYDSSGNEYGTDSEFIENVIRSFIFYFETLSFSDQQSCDPGEFLCHDHVTCVSQSWLCDGDPDCPDDSDESLDTCPG
ncbi:hypothetical protein E5288_WYG001283 [Bos mutus]|uniref:Uncharacterized protein n=1 Tax=Bos mutus TaxID=72004 RepID=A0A6B0RBS4_9CETA|nr:hypothetical protein [Bos mutus]